MELVTGDRVRIASTSVYYLANSLSNPMDVVGTVTKVEDHDNMNVKVIWDNGYHNVYDPSDLTLVEGILWES